MSSIATTLFALVLLFLSLHAQEKANPFRALANNTILVISPHPDDDIIGAGGALAYLRGRGNRLVVVFLSAGELGTFDISLTPDSVRRIRMREAEAAYRALGFPEANLIWLGYRDGELDFEPQLVIRKQLVSLIRRWRPDIVFALDPGGKFYRYHYRDHRSAALVSADAIGAAMWPLEYPELGVAHRTPSVYYFYTAESNLDLDIMEVYDLKLAALAKHRSQFAPASHKYEPDGPPPGRSDMEQLIQFLTGATTIERFRRR